MTKLGDIALHFVLGRSALVLTAVLVLTAPAAYLLWNAEFAPSIVESFVDDRQQYLRAEELERLFPGNPDAFVWLATTEGKLLFTEAKLRAIREAARDIRKVDNVRRVVALPNVPRPTSQIAGARGTAQRIVLNMKLKNGEVPKVNRAIDPVLPARLSDSRRNDRDLLELGEAITEDHDAYAGKLVSHDGRSHVMMVELDLKEPLQPGDQIKLIDSLTAIAKKHRLGEDGLYCSGLIPLQAYAFKEIDSVLYQTLPIGALLIALAVMLVFRRLEVILITAFIACISIAWGVGFGIYWYGKFSVLMAAVPLMVLVISTADVIHLISSYTAERESGLTHEKAIRNTFIHVGGACILTSLTTFVGFASLIFVPARTIKQFGVSAAAGVAGALILSVVFVPIFLDLLHRWRRPVTASVSTSRMIDAASAFCLRLGVRRPIAVLSLFVLGLLVCLAITTRLRLDPDLSQRFSSDHMITRSTEFFTEQYGGINSVELLVEGDPEQLLSPASMRELRTLEKAFTDSPYHCEDVNSIDRVLAQFLKRIDYENPEGIPETPEHCLASVAFLRSVEPELVNSLVTPDNRYLRLIARIPATSYLEMTRYSEELAAKVASAFGPQVRVLEKGSAPLVGRAVREIIRGHLTGFAFCFTTIFFLIAFGLRSWRLAWVSALPNMTPLLILGGLVAFFHSVADSDLLAVGTLGLGLAVDDTIHFLSRFKLECRKGKSVRDALEASMEHTGLAIIRTTLILSLGFFPFAFAEYWSINMLGTYLIAVLFSALLADLILLPAIIVLTVREPAAGGPSSSR
jgi:predicted RND superfamily exporter protein